MDAATLAGTVSTVLFAAANLPMVIKAVRSHDLRSYSASALILVNVGNVVYTAYVLSLPFGPIWVLHGFYLTTMGLMLVLFATSRRRARPVAGAGGRADRPPSDPAPKPPSSRGHERRVRAATRSVPVP